MAISPSSPRHQLEQLESRRLLSSYFLDPSFGTGGIAAVDVASARDVNPVLVTEVDGGKILAVGGIGIRDGTISDRVFAARFNADGSVDTAFGSGGVALSFEMGYAADAAVDADGNIVVLGAIERGADVFVARFTAAFVLDTQFGGGDGIITFDGNTGDLFLVPHSLAIGADGKVVVVGTVEPHEDDQIGVVRLTPGGALDTTFDSDGSAIIDRPELLHDQGVAVQEDGRIIVVGSEGAFPMVMRLTAGGGLDTTFGTGGIGHYPQMGINYVFEAAVQTDGKIVIGSNHQVGRLTPQGALDTSFSGDGVADFTGNVEWWVKQIRIDAGTGKIKALTQNGIMEYLTNGQVDPDFVEDGTIPWITDPDTGITPGLGWLAAAEGAYGVIYGGDDPSLLRVAKYTTRAVSFDQGHLLIAGTGGNDTITVEAAGNQARLTRNGEVTNYPLAQVLSVEVQAGEGDNVISVLLDVPTTVLGGSGDDSITTGAGPSSITAGDGDNSISIGSDGSITTGSGADTIVAGSGVHTITSGAGDDSITTGGGSDTIFAGDGDNFVSSGGGADFIESGPGADTIDGGDGDDRINAGHGDDSVDGGAGNDRIYGGNGLNTLLGGEGDDTIVSGDDADSILGGSGNDRLGAGHGRNTIFGGAGNDSICGGDGNDWFWGESGYDTMKGGLGNDFLHGGNGKDRLFGQQGDDRLYGSGNNDVLDGGPGRDLMLGGDGDDKLWGRDDEADTLEGGLGSDLAQMDLIDQFSGIEGILT